MEKILDIIELIAYEKGLDVFVVSQVVKEAIIKIAKKEINEDINYSVEEDLKDRTLRLIQTLLVCEDNDSRAIDSPNSFITLSKAREMAQDVNVGDEIKYDLNLEDMSRSAVNLLFRDLEFNIQRTIENQLFEKFKSSVGKIVTGVVVAIDDSQNTYIEIDEVRAVLALKNRIKGESFAMGDTVSSILKHVGIDKNGIRIELSRTTPKMLEELLKLEVPEIKDGEVVIERSARIPGKRAKIAVYSNSPKIDPIGSTVGTKGVRINAVSNELNGESIDCIEYSTVPEIFISKALSPANVISIKLESAQIEEVATNLQEINPDERSLRQERSKLPKAIVTIMSDQKSKAIGRAGVNISLASMLTGYEIELIEIDSDKSSQNEQVGSNQPPAKVGIDALESLFKQ